MKRLNLFILQVDEVALNEVDDEETIEQEEKIAIEDQHGSEMSTAVELEQLAADADCPLEDLLPPGYLEFITSNSPVVSEVQHSSASEVSVSLEGMTFKLIYLLGEVKIEISSRQYLVF